MDSNFTNFRIKRRRKRTNPGQAPIINDSVIGRGSQKAHKTETRHRGDTIDISGLREFSAHDRQRHVEVAMAEP